MCISEYKDKPIDRRVTLKNKPSYVEKREMFRNLMENERAMSIDNFNKQSSELEFDSDKTLEILRKIRGEE